MNPEIKRLARADLRARRQKAQAEELRVLSDAVQRYTTLLTDLSDIIAQYARAASPNRITKIAVDCFFDRQYTFWPLESDNMGSIFEAFISRLGLRFHPSSGVPFYYYPEHYDSNRNFNSERIMPNELCFKYRNSTVYVRPQTIAERAQSVSDYRERGVQFY
jgi:hypothetical protein